MVIWRGLYFLTDCFLRVSIQVCKVRWQKSDKPQKNRVFSVDRTGIFMKQVEKLTDFKIMGITQPDL